VLIRDRLEDMSKAEADAIKERLRNDLGVVI
jgi:hypothetical protein